MTESQDLDRLGQEACAFCAGAFQSLIYDRLEAF